MSVKSVDRKERKIGTLYYERCLSSWFKMIDELIVCLTIESQRRGLRRFDRYTAGLHQAMVSPDCVTV